MNAATGSFTLGKKMLKSGKDYATLPLWKIEGASWEKNRG